MYKIFSKLTASKMATSNCLKSAPHISCESENLKQYVYIILIIRVEVGKAQLRLPKTPVT